MSGLTLSVQPVLSEGGLALLSEAGLPLLRQAARVEQLLGPGSGVWVVPPNIEGPLTVECWGAGGGGARAGRAQGGGGGAYARSVLTVAPGTPFAWVVGSGGARRTNNGPGLDGSADTEFGAVRAERGYGAPTTGTLGGQGGRAAFSAGDIVHSGGNGGDASGTGSSGGGGAAHPLGAGTSAAAAASVATAGGASGARAGGAIASPGVSDPDGGSGGGGAQPNDNGGDGGTPGGGGGAVVGTGQSGAGAAGRVRLTWFMALTAGLEAAPAAPFFAARLVQAPALALPPILRRSGYAPAWADPSRRVRIIIVYGESRGANHSEGTGICYPPIVGAQRAQRVFMFNNPRAPGLTFEGDFTARDAMALIPLSDCRFGNRGEGWVGSQGDPIGQSLSTFAYALDDADLAAGTPRRSIFIVAGVGGRKSYELVRGAAPWAGRFGTFEIYPRLLRSVARAVELAGVLWGQACEVTHHLYLQGVNNINAPGGPTPALIWRDETEQHIIAALDQDVPPLTGQSSQIVHLLEQTPSDTRGRRAPASLAQSDMATRNLNGRTFLACVSYGLPLNARDDNADTGTLHHTARGVAWQGEVFARAALAIGAGSPLPRCRIISVARSGNTVTLTANRALVVDTSHFPDPGQLGFAVRDASGAILPGGVLASDVAGATVTLTVAPPAASIEYAHERPAGALTSGDGTAAWLDGETDVPGIPARTPGAWGVLRAADRAVPSTWAPGATIKDWLEVGSWPLPPA